TAAFQLSRSASISAADIGTKGAVSLQLRPGGERRELVVRPPRPAGGATELRQTVGDRVGRPAERRAGLAERVAFLERVRPHAAVAEGFHQGYPEELTREGVGADVLVRDRGGSAKAPHHEGGAGDAQAARAELVEERIHGGVRSAADGARPAREDALV